MGDACPAVEQPKCQGSAARNSALSRSDPINYRRLRNGNGRVAGGDDNSCHAYTAPSVKKCHRVSAGEIVVQKKTGRPPRGERPVAGKDGRPYWRDRKSTRLNSSH